MIILGAAWACAQNEEEYEVVQNPRTGEYELVHNPWNIDKTRNDARKRDQELFDLQQRHRREADERTYAMYDQFRRDNQAQMQEITKRHLTGLAIIRAGKATTRFTPSPRFNLLAYLTQRAQTPEARQQAQQYGAEASKRYHNELQARRLRENDLADGLALDFILCYEIYFRQRTTPAHLQFQRTVIAKYLLGSSLRQGADDLERQKDFEFFGALSMYAKMLSEQPATQAKAREIAASVLPTLWGKPIDTILLTPTGFAHKGASIIARGQATPYFTYNPALSAAQKLSQINNAPNLAATYQNYLNVFHQEMAKRGGQKNDLASYATFSLYANYIVLAGGKELNPAQTKSLYAFVKGVVLKSPDIQAASDENKQLACEIIAIRAMDAYQNRNSAVGLSFARKVAGDIFQALGEDPNNYQLTEQGVVRVKAAKTK
jgi:hypothetical protein